MKKILLTINMFIFSIVLLIGCDDITQVDSNNLETEKETISETENQTESEPEPQTELESESETEIGSSSSPTNDTDLGLKNIKIDSTDVELSEDARTILEYFDNDYLSVTEYEFLQRYPQIYQQTQVTFSGKVEKVITSTDTEYELLICLVENEDTYLYYTNDTDGYADYYDEHRDDLIIVKGEQQSARIIEGDDVAVYGRYATTESYDIDGISRVLPVVNAYQSHIRNNSQGAIVRFDSSFIKRVAKIIFGDDIQVRDALWEEDFFSARTFDKYPYMICELDNQSNAKFTKYRFYLKEGLIEDAKTQQSHVIDGNFNENILREIQFSADFEHFFLFIYDISLDTLLLEYYDTDLNKIWSREFEDTKSTSYDYTTNNIYLIANNELFIIDINTGTDTFSPQFIGQKLEIRKLRDGILLLSEDDADSIIKTDLQGNILWKHTLESPLSYIYGIQLIENRIVMEISDYDSAIHFYNIDNTDGRIIDDAVSLNSSDYYDGADYDDTSYEDTTYENNTYDSSTTNTTDNYSEPVQEEPKKYANTLDEYYSGYEPHPDIQAEADRSGITVEQLLKDLQDMRDSEWMN